MNRYTKIILTSLLALMFIVPAASARPMGGGFHGGFGGPVFVGPGWGYGFGWGPGWYGPGWYGPYGAYYTEPNPTGKLKFDTKAKDAMVYVDGGYAGTVGQLKTFNLKTGEHDVELRDPSGHSYYHEQVNILPGKTLTLNPNAR
jgi:hypothetical protein